VCLSFLGLGEEEMEAAEGSLQEHQYLETLINAGPEGAAKMLKSRLTSVSNSCASSTTEAFVRFLFAHESVQLETALVFCMWLSCGGMNPNTVLQKMKSNSAGKASATCGRVWKEGDLAYNCADCQYDDTW